MKKSQNVNVNAILENVAENVTIEKTAKIEKPKNRIDFLLCNAIKFDDIKINDRLMFNDIQHAENKNVEKMLKYAYVIDIDATKQNMLAVVSNAIYVFNKKSCESFLFAKLEHDKNIVKIFSNILLTVKNFALHFNVIKPFEKNPLVIDFMTKNALAIETYKTSHKIK